MFLNQLGINITAVSCPVSGWKSHNFVSWILILIFSLKNPKYNFECSQPGPLTQPHKEWRLNVPSQNGQERHLNFIGGPESQITEQMCLETHFQHEFSFLSCCIIKKLSKLAVYNRERVIMARVRYIEPLIKSLCPESRYYRIRQECSKK